MVTLADLDAWDVAVLGAAADSVVAARRDLLALGPDLEDMDVPWRATWTGDASSAARSTLHGLHDRVEHLMGEVSTVQLALDDAVDEVGAVVAEWEAIRTTAAQQQLSVAASGTVTDVATPPAGADAAYVAARTSARDALVARIEALLERATAVDVGLTTALAAATESTIGDGGASDVAGADATATTSDGRYSIGDPQRPDIPRDDDFEYDSRDPGVADQVARIEWLGKLRAAQVAGVLPDGTRFYEHYWGNTGDPAEFDLGRAVEEDSGMRAGVDGEIARARAAVEELVANGHRDFSFTGDARAADGYPRTENWQKAVGGYQVWSHGDVTVEGNRVTMTVTVNAEDRYNFNAGESDIATGTSDDENGRFTEVGWARPFDTHGDVTRTVTWELGEAPPAPGPSTDDEARGRDRERQPTPDNPRSRGRG